MEGEGAYRVRYGHCVKLGEVVLSYMGRNKVGG